MHILIVLHITYVITLYIWGLLVWGVAFAFFFVAAVTLTLLSFVVKFKFIFASGYIAFEIIRFYKPASQAKIFSAACFILFLIHFPNISGEIFFIISVLFLSPLFIKKIPIPNISNKKGTSYFLNIKNLLKDNSNFKYLCLSYFFIGLSNGVTSILFILFVEFIVGGSPQNFLFIYFISAFMGLPFVYMLASKYNKKRIWTSFILLACICFLPVVFLSNNSTTLFMVICIISGFCLSADLIIPSSIQADIIYKEQQKNKSVLVGKIYSVWSFIQKSSLALSAGVCLPLLGYFGFNPSEVNTQLLPLSFAYGIIPIILRIPAIIFAENIILKD